MRAKLQAIKQELRQGMHQPIPEQGKWLKQVVTGYYNYHAVPTNGPALAEFRIEITKRWRRILTTATPRVARSSPGWRPHRRHLPRRSSFRCRGGRPR